MRTLELRIP